MRGIAGGKASATSSSDDRPGCSSIGSTPHQGKLRPRRAGRSPGWPTRAGECGASWVGRVRHPIDLPEGYHTATRGQSSPDRVALRRGPPPGRRVVGRCQVDGMPHEPVVSGANPERMPHARPSPHNTGRHERAAQAAQDVSRWASASTLTRKRPPSPGRQVAGMARPSDAVTRPVDINADHNPMPTALDERERRRTADQHASAPRPTYAAP